MTVFDSSALLAYIRGEQGSDVVREILEKGDGAFYVHSVNLCEMHHILMRSNDFLFVERTITSLTLLGVLERPGVDGGLWRLASGMIEDRHLEGASLPLSVAIAVALAKHLDAQFVTADRATVEPLYTYATPKPLFIR